MSRHIPTREDARQDPEHRLWFAWIDAVEVMRIHSSVDNVEAVDAAWQAFMADFTRPVSSQARGIAA